jgi:hypothetical protein
MSGPGNFITSGDTIYNQTATEIITAAYQICSVINDEEVPNAAQFRTGMGALNALVKLWLTIGIHVWTEEEALLFLQQGQIRYLLGGTTLDHCTDAAGAFVGETSVSAIAGATSIQLVTPAVVLTGQKFGVVLDTGTAFWTTATADIATNGTVTFADPLPASASMGNNAFAYTTDIVRPLRIPAVRRLQYNGLLETPLTKMMSRQEYMDLPNKYNPGLVNQAFYNPARTQGELYVWQQPQDATFGLRFTWYRPIENFDSPADLPDFPQEWTNVLQWNLAKELGPRFSLPADRWDRIVMQADQKKEMAEGWDREFQSVLFGLSHDQTLR